MRGRPRSFVRGSTVAGAARPIFRRSWRAAEEQGGLSSRRIRHRQRACLAEQLTPPAPFGGLKEPLGCRTNAAILIDSGSSILGFAVLLFSRVPANHRLGGLLALSLGVCVVATLLVVPALAAVASLSGRGWAGERLRLGWRAGEPAADQPLQALAGD
jgi:hypothetical protein